MISKLTFQHLTDLARFITGKESIVFSRKFCDNGDIRLETQVDQRVAEIVFVAADYTVTVEEDPEYAVPGKELIGQKVSDLLA